MALSTISTINFINNYQLILNNNNSEDDTEMWFTLQDLTMIFI
jgi:hypothetical protein